MKYVLFILSIFVFSCSHHQEHAQKMTPKAEAPVVKVEKTYPVEQKQIRPGEVTKIKFFYAGDVKSIICRDQTIPVYREKDHYAAFVAESYWSKMDPYQCMVEGRPVAELKVLEKDFPSETLNVDMKRVMLNEKDQKRVAKEQIFLNAVYRASPENPLFTDAFQMPINADVTSIYGSRRLFNKQKQTQHLGTDFRAPIGEKIFAANAGKVVVARDLFFTGNTITIDHGLGIFTIYGHLSKLNAVEGDIVPKGALIGFSGATGRVTGPHLHWGVKVNGQFVEGESLVSTSKE